MLFDLKAVTLAGGFLIFFAVTMAARHHGYRTLSQDEMSVIVGGQAVVDGKECEPDPRCTDPSYCTGVSVYTANCSAITDPGLCFNSSSTGNRMALNQNNCLKPAPGKTCCKGPDMEDDSCQVYNMCYWDATFMSCRELYPSQPCFSFPTYCVTLNLNQACD